ncbi:MAG: ribonuclease HI family protein [Gammaproteobacteria bacterium]
MECPDVWRTPRVDTRGPGPYRRQGRRHRDGAQTLTESIGECFVVFADGASRGNPGPASIGAAIFDASGHEVHAVSRRIGRATNNEAEYQAAIAGLEAALALGAGCVSLRMDSELVVRQLEYRYKVRNPRLQPMFARLLELRRRFATFDVDSIPRAMNKRADQLANQALDSPAGPD